MRARQPLANRFSGTPGENHAATIDRVLDRHAPVKLGKSVIVWGAGEGAELAPPGGPVDQRDLAHGDATEPDPHGQGHHVHPVQQVVEVREVHASMVGTRSRGHLYENWNTF